MIIYYNTRNFSEWIFLNKCTLNENESQSIFPQGFRKINAPRKACVL